MSSSAKIIIIGAGLSGLMTAIKLAEEKQPVILFSPGAPSYSDSSYDHSLFNAAFNSMQDGDSPERHFTETIAHGDFLANQDLPRKMCEEAPNMACMLSRMGVAFTVTEEGLPRFTASEGSPHFRTLSTGFETGRQIRRALERQVRCYAACGLVKMMEGWEFLSVVRDLRGIFCGISAINTRTMEIGVFAGRAAIFCTGGSGALFGRSTQSVQSMGSAVSILYRQGAFHANSEFFQFQPAISLGNFRFMSLGSDALDNGGRFWVPRDGKKWFFMEELYPHKGIGLPNIVICRVLHKVIYNMGLGVEGKDFVYFDFSNNFFRRPSPVPVMPVVSYSLGGLWTDENHMINIAGIFAAGECQYHYHGANAVSANIIPASLYSGQKAAMGALLYVRKTVWSDAGLDDIIQNEIRMQNLENRRLADSMGHENVYRLHCELGECMDENMGLVRHNAGLKKTNEKIMELTERLGRLSLSDRGRWANREMLFARNLRNMLELARAVVACAIMRDESRGVHYKPEFPKRNDQKFLKTTRARCTPNGPEIEYEDVDLKYMKTGS